MSARTNLGRLAVDDPTAAAAVVDALWDLLAREDPRLFSALWRRANRPSRRTASSGVQVPIPVQWVEPEPVVSAVEAAAQRLPSVNLAPAAAPVPIPVAPLMIEPSPSLADLIPADERTSV